MLKKKQIRNCLTDARIQHKRVDLLYKFTNYTMNLIKLYPIHYIRGRTLTSKCPNEAQFHFFFQNFNLKKLTAQFYSFNKSDPVFAEKKLTYIYMN